VTAQIDKLTVAVGNGRRIASERDRIASFIWHYEPMNPEYCQALRSNLSRATRFLIRSTLPILLVLMASIASAGEIALLANDSDALRARIEMIDQAKEEICFACYEVDSSDISIAFLALLRDKARQGVKVRVLIDGFVSRLSLPTQQHLAANGVEIRVFHPLFKGGPEWLNRRMHSKLLLVDRHIMVVGSRNLSSRNYGLDEGAFVNCDAMMSGSVCQDAAKYFDWLWAAPDVLPIGDCVTTIEKPSDARKDRAGNKCRVPFAGNRPFGCFAQKVPDTYFPLIAKSRMWDISKVHAKEELARLVEKTFASDASCPQAAPFSTHIDDACLLHDRDTNKSEGTLTSAVINLVDSAQASVMIESPYPAFSPQFMDALKRARARGVEVVLLTNSLRSTDQVIAYAAYQNQKAPLLNDGVKLYEFSGPKNLHTKGMVIDDRIAMMGSYNFDARSERLNLELCVVTHREDIAQLIKQSMLGRSRYAQRVDQHHQADVTGKATTQKKIHLRSSQLLAPLLRPML
jgi:putative cardiolipin synthase